jgi:hypothetical protein
MSIGVPHVGHTAAWEYIEKDSILRIKQFRQTDDRIVANFLHLQVSGPEEAAIIAAPIVQILSDRTKISGMAQSMDGGVMYVFRPYSCR